MSIPSSLTPLFSTGSSSAAGYQVSRSLRFNSADSAYLSRTPAVAGNRRTWTLSAWLKRCAEDQYGAVLSATGTPSRTLASFYNGNIYIYSNGGINVSTVGKFRDPSAWYHVLWVLDTTQAIAADRTKIYVNGIQQTLTYTTSPNQNTDWGINNTGAHRVGSDAVASEDFNGYLADIHFIDGQALTPSSFTEVSATTGQLISIAYTGTFGTNGFWLKFSDNSAATAAALGNDYSGNNNDWTPNNFSVSTSAINYSNNNQVTGSYTSGWTTGYGPEKMFDGNLATYTDQVDTGPGGAVAYLYWSPSPTIGVNSLRIYGSWYKAGQNPYVDYDQVSINGNPYVGNAGATATFAWWDLTSYLTTYSITTITNITFQRTPIGGNRVDPNIAAVEVNGSILINATPADNDSLVDTPTSTGTDTGVGNEVRGNYCTLNPVGLGGGTLSNGNLDLSTSTAVAAVGTVAMKTGKWYWEITCNTVANPRIGVFNIGASSPTSLGNDANGWCLLNGPSRTYNSGSAPSYGTFSPVNGTIVNVAYDADAGKLWFGQDGSYFASGNPATGANASMSSVTGSAIVPALSSGGTDAYSVNFGQRAFAYTAPSGFKALCDTNLPAPSIAKPNTVMDVVLWTGSNTATARTISGLQFSPDLVWAKSRSLAYSHNLYDTVRGTGKGLYSDSTTAESTNNIYGYISAFTSDGFTGTPGSTDNGYFNQTNATYVAWTWDAGTSTVSNTSGSITSQVRANVSAGFSICTFSIVSASATISTFGHGLGVAPSFVIFKVRNAVDEWTVYHGSISSPTSNWVTLNTTNAAGGGTSTFSTSSTTFGVRETRLVASSGSGNILAYCFAPVVGYSSMGSYVGNASADGPVVYLGFRPRFVIIKCSSTSNSYTNWDINDSARNTYNAADNTLCANLSDQENSGNIGGQSLDFLANGFKIRQATSSSKNLSGQTYIYCAWAENPFQYARAR